MDRIGDHSPSGVGHRPVDLELGLGEHDHPALRTTRADESIHDPVERDEGQVGDHCVEGTQPGGVHVPEIRSFHGRHAGITTEPLVQLVVTDIERDDVSGASLEQAVGEPAGRRSGVEGLRAGRPEAEAVERGIELLAAATDEPGRGRHHRHRLAGIDETSRNLGRRPVDQDPTGADQILCCGAIG